MATSEGLGGEGASGSVEAARQRRIVARTSGATTKTRNRPPRSLRGCAAWRREGEKRRKRKPRAARMAGVDGARRKLCVRPRGAWGAATTTTTSDDDDGGGGRRTRRRRSDEDSPETAAKEGRRSCPRTQRARRPRNELPYVLEGPPSHGADRAARRAPAAVSPDGHRGGGRAIQPISRRGTRRRARGRCSCSRMRSIGRWCADARCASGEAPVNEVEEGG